MQRDLAVLFEKYASNILTPAMSKLIVDELGVSISAIEKLGVGYNPANGAFVFPERDEDGKIIGICQRYRDGKKGMVKGSKRGLFYPVDLELLKGDKYVQSASMGKFGYIGSVVNGLPNKISGNVPIQHPCWVGNCRRNCQ